MENEKLRMGLDVALKDLDQVITFTKDLLTDLEFRLAPVLAGIDTDDSDKPADASHVTGRVAASPVEVALIGHRNEIAELNARLLYLHERLGH